MNHVYVAFLAPKNKMGRFIRFFTRNKYSHVAISLDKNLEIMYSFARRKWRLPLAGGFVIEYPIHYASDTEDSQIKLSRLSLSDDSYNRLISIIKECEKDKDAMIYNSIDAVVSSLFHKSIYIKNCYTCISFACYLLGVRKIYTIPELERKLKDNVIYEGNFSEYVKISEYQDPSYYESIGYVKIVLGTIYHFGRLFYRFVKEIL